MIHRCETTAAKRHYVFIYVFNSHLNPPWFHNSFENFQSLKKIHINSLVKFHSYENSNSNLKSISPYCVKLVLLKFFLWLGKVFLLFLPWSRHFQWQSHEPACKKRSLNFLQKEKPTISKDVSITISKQFEQWMRFKKGEDFFKRLEREKKNLGSKYKIFLTKKRTNKIKD